MAIGEPYALMPIVSIIGVTTSKLMDTGRILIATIEKETKFANGENS